MPSPRDATFLVLDPADNLAVALRDVEAGFVWRGSDEEGAAVRARAAIPAKHKMALRDIVPGEPAVMYGTLVGRATEPIAAGGLVTTGNLAHAAAEAGYRGFVRRWEAPEVSAWRERAFEGIRRSGGRWGTANHWLVIPLVFCENRNVAKLRDALLRPLGYATAPPMEREVERLVETWRRTGRFEHDVGGAAGDGGDGAPDRAARVFPRVDGVRFLSHSLGCGGTDDDAAALTGLLAGYVTHPNVAGATVLSLGCQKATIRMLESEISARDPGFDRPFRIFEAQGWSSEREMMGAMVRFTLEGMASADALRREPAPLSALTLGMECGGSDGFSGISANPVIGAVADRIVALGGRVILSEFPELCGAEQDLLDRCESPEVAARFLDLMRRYAEAARRAGSGFEANPSPGNVADGLITDAIKSCGAARKGGTSPVADVLDYPEPVRRDGLTLLCTPGNDVESTTAMAGSGANLMLFSTGLGTPTGNPVAPVIKISTSTRLAESHPDMIDFDAGPVIGGSASPTQLAETLLDQIIEVASGRRTTCAQALGQEDFIPWKRGVSL